jgi:hypothetical protein
MACPSLLGRVATLRGSLFAQPCGLLLRSTTSHRSRSPLTPPHHDYPLKETKKYTYSSSISLSFITNTTTPKTTYPAHTSLKNKGSTLKTAVFVSNVYHFYTQDGKLARNMKYTAQITNLLINKKTK